MINFYPRPPRGGRPGYFSGKGYIKQISIHALREEGDLDGFTVQSGAGDFYPRPPRGGRLFDLWLALPDRRISIHALREEGDRTSFI